jgi:hypothetical protein
VAGVLISPLKVGLSIAVGLAALLTCAWLVDCAALLQAGTQGLGRLRALLADDLEQGVALAARQGAGPRVITAPANALYALVFEATGIHGMGARFSEAAAVSIPDTVLRRGYLASRDCIEAAMLGTQRVGVRAAILTRFTPLLLLLYGVAVADGFAQRAVRRACGGRESAGLYHRAKFLQVAVLALGGASLLLWPGPVRWALCVPLGAILAAGLCRAQWTYYKKHM